MPRGRALLTVGSEAATLCLADSEQWVVFWDKAKQGQSRRDKVESVQGSSLVHGPPIISRVVGA